MDNFYLDCPPMMSDGRLFTDFRTAIRRDEGYKYMNGIVRDDEYRVFLQQNAEKIMDETWKYTSKNKTCWKNECIHNYPTRAYPPWFVEERKAYDKLQLPKNKRTEIYTCPRYEDYRATHTNSVRY